MEVSPAGSTVVTMNFKRVEVNNMLSGGWCCEVAFVLSSGSCAKLPRECCYEWKWLTYKLRLWVKDVTKLRRRVVRNREAFESWKLTDVS
ncbi:MAG: hypothetical protein ACTS41_01625 [Candidatus Hodgkinia cicadicola]